MSYVLRHSDLRSDVLTPDDWDMLVNLHDFLRDFYEATKATEGHNDSINKALPLMDFLFRTLERGRSKTDWKSKEVHPAIETAWAKLEKYYEYTDDSPVYVASVVMDPRWKWSYFTKYWSARPDWIQKARTAVLNLWKNEYLARAINLNLDLDSSSATAFMIEADPGMGVRPRNGLAVYYNDFDLPTALDEYELYIAEARVSPDCLPVDNDPLSWWLDPVQQKHFPTLQKMALDLLSIPAMSADTDRLFSLAKLTNTQIRNRIQDSTL